MSAPRRLGAPDAKNRTVLMDAAEQLMLEQGWATVTSRRIAEHAGLKPQLVHYYFRSMDELFLELFRRRADQGLEALAQVLKSERPLHALWEFSTDATAARFTMEFVGLANQKPAVRAEVVRYSEQFRAAQTEALGRMLADYGVDTSRFPAEVLSVLMTSAARMVVLEQALGMTAGHAETFAFAEREIDLLEPEQ
ncbi:TetR/AcrR family transcriptional regulator [Nocardia flavorosea]|uniref:TetR/AcrR family transcriptional regulator n=1 Tax=Nocardia flavorosea TaxID=53429 RepID=A0A846YIQ6_9NOCA|nr:TetR/AcrR family transcriptional regulator [Nocardia flavorosea]NKY57524.1 TetR/AcrR family transcriptional regulator [Nocardia flavorosea]